MPGPQLVSPKCTRSVTETNVSPDSTATSAVAFIDQPIRPAVEEREPVAPYFMGVLPVPC